jgi:flagellar assembly protein FliH
MGKIIKDPKNNNVESHSFSVFTKVEKGTKPYEVKTFSTVERGTKNFIFRKLEEKTENKTQDLPSPSENLPEKNISEENETKNIDYELLLKEEVEKARKIAIEEGYKKGFEEAKTQFNKKYEAEKNDYLENLKSFMDKAINELNEIKSIINSFDTEVPQIVLNLVKEIVGTEKKLNDELIISLIKENIDNLLNFDEVIFLINPDDESIVKEHYPNYKIEVDPTIIKGGFKVKTNIGNIDFSIEHSLKLLENSINEKFKSS